MHENLTRRFLVPVLKSCLLVAAIFYGVVFLGNAATRVPYKYELEWMEGGAVCHVERVLDGKGLYCAPSAEFVPFIYTPLYYYVSAAVARVTGLGFLPLRLVSFCASLGCAAMIVLIVVRRCHASLFYGVVAAGFFLASFRVTGRWLDIARVDPLFLFLLLSAVYAFQSPKPGVNSFWAAVLMFLAFFTKQTAIVIALSLCLWCLFFRAGWSRISFAVCLFILLGLSTLLMNGVTDGWYSYYVFSLPGQHAVDGPKYYDFWRHDIFDCAAIACLISAFCVLRGQYASRSERWLDVALLGGLVFAGWSARLHSDGYLNVLLPTFAGLAIFFGVGLSKAAARLDRRWWLVAGLYALAIVQFQQMFFLPSEQVPSAAATEMGDKLLKTLSRLDGDVFMSSHPWYPGMIGKGTCAQNMAIFDVLRASASSAPKAAVKTDIVRRIARRDYGALVIDLHEFPFGCRELEENYHLVNSHLTPTDFVPLAGSPMHPTLLYVRKNVPRPAATPATVSSLNARR